MKASIRIILVGLGLACTLVWARGQTQINLPAPIVQETFESVNEGELPAGWTVVNYTDDLTAGQDLDDPSSDSYKNWVVISRDRVLSIGVAGRWDAQLRLSVAPNQFVNGALITNLAEGKFIYAESDTRGNSQVQYLFSPDFNLSGKSNVYVVYNSIYEQNQDSIGAVDYSIDGGTNWLPIIYMIDAADIIRDASGNIDAVATLDEPRGDAAVYVDPVSGAAGGGTYGAFIGAPITTNLAPYISGRVNDDSVESKRVEVFRLIAADNQSKVRFRFAQAGTGSWYFGIDNFGLYSIAPAVDHPNKPTITAPAKVDFFANTTLTGSAFQGSNANEKHTLSVWQISPTSSISATDGFANVQESISSTNNPTSLTTKLQTIFPGRTYYATVQYRDQNGAKSDFADPVSFTVDALPAPIVFESFESIAAGSVPAGWTISNQTDGATGSLDPADLGSDTYLDWTVIAFDQLSTFGGGRGDTNVAIGNSMYAESDTRGGNQIQFVSTADFSTLGKTGVWVAFRSNYEQNQDSLGAVEYSIDGGATWLPLLYVIDRDDLKLAADGSVDATATLTTTYGDVAKVLDPATGDRVAAGKYEDFLLARPISSLGPFISGRINDNATESKRYERFALPAADNQAKVRLRFVQAGTGSWYWGVDDLGLYAIGGQSPPPVGLTINSITPRGNALSLSWSGGTAPYLVQMKASLSDSNWFSVLTTPAQTATVAKVGNAAFFRVADQATSVVIPLTAQLSGAGEVPAVTTDGSGLGAFSLEGDTLTYLISFNGLSGSATASHIHGPAEVTGTAPVIIPFVVSSTSSGIISGSVTVTPDQKTNLLSGKTYANIHTGAHPGGEIRGQVNLAQFTAKMNGSAEVPAVATPATGDGTFALIGNQLFYDISFTGLSSNATAAHIHGPADISLSAPVIIPFTVSASTSGTISGTVTVTADQLTNLVSGKTYANIHTGAHPGGEIRGQIVTLLLKATLSGAAEVPAVSTTASATGVFALTGNQLNYVITYSGLSGDATASHIHGPADVTGTAPVIIPFTVSAGTSGTIAGTVAVTSDQLTHLLAGRAYANIHTAANPGGEIRGQITP